MLLCLFVANAVASVVTVVLSIAADVIIMNNVFEFFAKKNLQSK